MIRSNSLSRGRRQDIYLANSHDVEVVGNTVKTLSSGVELFQDGQAISQGELNNDLIDGNRIRVITAGALAGRLYCSNLTATECSSYSTSRNNRFQSNTYVVPDLLARYWYWNGGGKDVVGVAGRRPRPRRLHPVTLVGPCEALVLHGQPGVDPIIGVWTVNRTPVAKP